MNLIYVRYRQVLFLIKKVPVYMFLLAGAMVLAVIGFIRLENTSAVNYLSVGYAVILLIKNNSRKDYFLTQRMFRYPVLQHLSDILLLAFPLLFALLWKREYFLETIILGILVLGVLIPYRLSFLKKKSIVIHFPNFIITNYEWIFLSRQCGIALFAFILAAILLCWIKLIPLFFLALFQLIILDRLSLQSEPIAILRASLENPRQFLLFKCRVWLIPWVIVSFPVCIVGIVIHSEFWYIYLGFFLYIAYLSFLLLIIKYSNYTPGENNQNTILMTICLVSLIVPVFIPVCLLLSLIHYPKSIENLNKYLC